MSPRPRTIDDAEILDAVFRVITRNGPSKLTLALVAKEAGIAPATLVQRFGSKTQMLRALARYGAPDVRASAGRATEGPLSPLERVREYALCWADLAGTPKAYLNSLQAFIEIELGDPVMYKSTLAASRETETVMTELVSDAISAGSIRGSNARAIARVFLAVAHGSLMSWATRREGKAREWLSRDVDALIEAFSRTVR